MSGLADTEMIPHEQCGGNNFFSVALLCLRKRPRLTSIVLDCTLTNFTPDWIMREFFFFRWIIPLRLIYTAFTYGKRYVCFKQCNHLWTHMSIRPLRWHTMDPQEGSTELRVSDNNKLFRCVSIQELHPSEDTALMGQVDCEGLTEKRWSSLQRLYVISFTS